MKDLNKAIDLWNQNEDLPPKDRLSMRAISRITGIAKTTLTERLTGRRKGEGKILGGACKGRVLTKGKPWGGSSGLVSGPPSGPLSLKFNIPLSS